MMRTRAFASCPVGNVLDGTPEEDALVSELRRLDDENASRKQALIAQLAAARAERGKVLAQRLARCAKVVAPSMPDDSSVCFRFKGGQAEMFAVASSERRYTAARPEDVGAGAQRKKLYAIDHASGMSLKQIAQKYGVKEGTVWASLFRGGKVR